MYPVFYLFYFLCEFICEFILCVFIILAFCAIMIVGEKYVARA